MKGILVILDGLGDLPHKLLGNKTPLEAAETPNLDFLAARGEMGYLYPVRPYFVPESDEAIVSVFANDLISSSRGQLEAKGAGIKVTRGDLALRVNFATIDDDKLNVVDRRVGRTLTTDEAQFLANEINKKVKLPMKFEFKVTVQHRAALVLRGGFSDNISGNDVFYPSGGKLQSLNLNKCKPLDDDENAQYTANIVNDFINQAQKILDDSFVNKERVKRGLMPANHLIVRGPGIEKPKLRMYKKWMAITYMPVEIGFAKFSGMKVFSFEYPKLRNLDAYGNLYEGLKTASAFFIKTLKKNHKKFDYTYVHFKETDVPGHDNKPLEKKEMIEYLDKTVFRFLRRFAPQKGVKVVVTGDHSTPCKLKAHSADPVPVLFYNNSVLKQKRFNEKNARRGTLGKIEGKELLSKVGFIK